MNAPRMSDIPEQQSQTSNDASLPLSSVRRQQTEVEFVSQERMSVLGLEGPGLPLVPPTGPGRVREALNAVLKRWSGTSRPVLTSLVGLRDPLRVKPVLRKRWMAEAVRMQRAQRALREWWMAAVPHMQRARHVLLERWMAADFRTRQLPILAVAAAIWASTAWIAWRADDSATPLLRNSLAAAKSQRSALGGGGVPRRIAEPADPPDAVRSGPSRQQASASLSLNQIMEFLISGTTPPREHPGNPQLQVWADTHTGLYYCPADNGYRRSSRGHFMSQKEAQDNSFQPASGAACR